MADTTATNYVTISVDMPDWGTKNAVFTLLEELAIADNGEVVLQKVYTLTLDAAGVGTINLPVYDTAGTGAWGYKLDAPDRTMHLFVLSGDPSSQSLGTILASAATSQTPDAIIGILANKQDKDADATAGNVAIFDANGQTVDAGFAASWNADDETVDVPLNDNVTLQLGHEVLQHVKNGTGATITNGTPAMYASPVGNSGRFEVQLARADGTLPSQYITGIATEEILAGEFGKVTWSGIVRGIDTTGTPYGETWADGDLIYVSATPGDLTNIEPNAPSQRIFIGTVNSAHAQNGSIEVKPSWNQTLANLDDVNGTPLTSSGLFPVWDNDNGYFDFTANISDFSGIGFDTLSNVLVVDPSFTAATPGWGVYAFATLTTAVAGAVSGDTVYVNGVTTEPGAIVIPAGVHCYVMQNSRVTTDGGTTLADVTLAFSTASFVAAGQNSKGNLASGSYAGVGDGGERNKASGSYAGVGSGGSENEATGIYAGTGSGGGTKQATGYAAGVGSGGIGNKASGDNSGVGNGGYNNVASGDYTGITSGSSRAKATHLGAKLSSDSQDFDFPSAAIDEFAVRAVGGVRLVTAIDGAGTPTATLTIDGQDGTAAIRDADGVAGNAANIDANGDAVDSGIVLGTAAASAVGDFDGAGSAAAAQAFAIQRANHTGSQLASTISDFAATVRSTVLTGLSTATATVITAADTVLTGLGKLQAQISGHVAATGTAVHGLGTMSTQTATNYVPISGGTYTGVVNFAAVAVSPIVVHNAGTAGTRFQLSGGTNTASVGFVIGEGSQAAPVTRAFVGWQRVLNVVSLTNGISTNLGVHVDLATGFVGVATNTPTATLHVNGNMKVITMKSGATQAAAGAAAGEPWYTSGHATLPDSVMMYGV